MSAFQFPDPASQQTATNPSTGSTYNWVADPGKWVLVSSNSSQGFPEQVTYQIQTDKILRSGDPAIELVDSAGFYSNVKFTGIGGVGVTSDFNGIIIDGTNIQPDNTQINTNKDDIALLKKSKVTQYKYKIKSVESGLASRDGEIIVNSLDAKLITLISLAPSDINGAKTKPIMIGDIIEFDYNDSVVRYIAESADTNVLMVTYVSGSRSMITNDSLYITIYPQNVSPITTETIQSLIGDTGNALTLSLISGLKLAVTTAEDFQDLREKMLLKLSEIEITTTL